MQLVLPAPQGEGVGAGSVIHSATERYRPLPLPLPYKGGGIPGVFLLPLPYKGGGSMLLVLLWLGTYSYLLGALRTEEKALCLGAFVLPSSIFLPWLLLTFARLREPLENG